MKLGLCVVGIVGALGSGCGEFVLPAEPDCGETIAIVHPHEDPDTFERATTFESPLTVSDRFGIESQAGTLTVVEVSGMETSVDNGCVDVRSTTARVLVELEAGDDFFVTLPAQLQLFEDGETELHVFESAPLDATMRLPYTPREHWRITGLRFQSANGARTLQAEVIPDVCEDVADCEHTEYDDVLVLELD